MSTDTDRLTTEEVAELLRSTPVAEPLSALTRLSVTLLRGGWANLSDRVLDIRGKYRDNVIAHRYLQSTRVLIVASRLADLAAGLVVCGTCGESQDSPYATACRAHTPDNMVEA